MKRVKDQTSVKMCQRSPRIKRKHPIELGQCLDTPAEVVECPPQVQMSFDVVIRQLCCFAKMTFCFHVLGLIQLLHAQEQVSTRQILSQIDVIRPSPEPLRKNFDGPLIAFLLSGLNSDGQVESFFFRKSLEPCQRYFAEIFCPALRLVQAA